MMTDFEKLFMKIQAQAALDSIRHLKACDEAGQAGDGVSILNWTEFRGFSAADKQAMINQLDNYRQLKKQGKIK